MASKQKIAERLRQELQAAIAERKSAKSKPAVLAARTVLRRFQSERMARTHADLLKSPDSRAAALFFLDELYGPHDLAQRDANIERVLPAMERMLPVSALETITEAVALDALSEKLDGAMAQRLGERFAEEDYIDAYRTVATRADRERQIAHVESVGISLCEVVGVPLVGSTLAMMRGPAKLANLSDLQSFLERGFKAFKGMQQPQKFVTTIVQREQAILENLYAGKRLAPGVGPFAV